LVGNKADLPRQVPIEQASSFAKEHNMAFFEVSAKEDGDTIKEMFKSIAEQFLNTRGITSVANLPLIQRCIQSVVGFEDV
jgi:hypothetical protein